MTAEDEGQEERAAGPEGSEGSADDKKRARDRMGDGLKQGIGVLSAFRDALEETIQEARERGDLSTDKAKEVVKDALDKAQAAGERARDKLDFATQADMETVQGAVDSVLERVSRLEESVFGASRDASEASSKAGDAHEENEEK